VATVNVNNTGGCCGLGGGLGGGLGDGLGGLVGFGGGRGLGYGSLSDRGAPGDGSCGTARSDVLEFVCDV